MADILTKKERSVRMSRIRSKDTTPELALRKALHGLGFRYRLHGADLPGRPDIVMSKHKAVVLVHGCFWHRHAACKVAATPKSNAEFWSRKFEANVLRDKRNVNDLKKLGWRVFVVWECELTRSKLRETVQRLAFKIMQGVD